MNVAGGAAYAASIKPNRYATATYVVCFNLCYIVHVAYTHNAYRMEREASDLQSPHATVSSQQ